jgi:hypothetical protein
MVQLPCPDEMSAWEPTGTGWSYWRPDLDVVVEVGTLRGNEVGLPAHLHRENQVVTFVVSGRTKCPTLTSMRDKVILGILVAYQRL